MNQYYILSGKNSSLILDLTNTNIQILYWGKKLSAHTQIQMLRDLSVRQEVPASPQKEVALSLCPTAGQGFVGHPGIQLHADAQQWSLLPELTAVNQLSEQALQIVTKDAQRQLELIHQVNIDMQSDVVSIQTKLTNYNDRAIQLDWCAAACVPIPSHISQRIAFEGTWAMEFQAQKSQQNIGSYVRENRRGRTSHDCFPGLIMHAANTDQCSGQCYGFHLGWSGNHKVVSEKVADGRAYVQMGELLLPGELQLQAGQSYQSPKLYMSFSDKGLNGLSQQFHRYVRAHLIRHKTPRPVHYNTWEGIYFDHKMPTLLDLVDRAAAVGVERFVLDDGWFPGRDDDSAGLGDWFVDKQKYPHGLTPLIKAVISKGMQFGLWFEPEMVNPNSNLYRQHPEWVLSCGSNPHIPFRNQLVLDLTQQAVFDYLFERIDNLLTEYDISYIKWDMNRDLNHPGDIDGKPVVRNQTLAFYALVDKLKQVHPAVEIESCASGGGRADYGVLEHTDRIWTSDSNDALDRLKIQRGFSYFLPAELMGSHVGPKDCHITHRHIGMNLRASVALFGHMGMEMDLRELNAEEQHTLSAMVAIYKTHRSLIHSGDLYRLDLPDYAVGFGIVATDQQSALFSYNVVGGHTTSMPDRYCFEGLEPDTNYQLNIIWPLQTVQKWPQESIFGYDTCLPLIHGQEFSGESLMYLGLQMPRLVPQSNLTFHLTAT